MAPDDAGSSEESLEDLSGASRPRPVTAPWERAGAVGRGGRRKGESGEQARVPHRSELQKAQPPQPPPEEPGLELADGDPAEYSREEAASFWSLSAVPVAEGSGTLGDAGQSLSGEGDEFDPATGWTFSGLDSEPAPRPVPRAKTPRRPLATADELFGPAATGESATLGPEPTPAPTPEPAPPMDRPRGLQIPTMSGEATALSDAAQAMRRAIAADASIEVVLEEEEEEILTSGHVAVVLPPPEDPAPEDPPPEDDVESLLGQGRDLLSGGEDGAAVLLLRRAHRLAPTHPVVQTWRELGERRMLQAHCPGVKPDGVPQLVGHRLDYWQKSDEMERQLLVAIDGKRSVGRLMIAAPDDKLETLLQMIGAFGERGWISWK